jgi:diguanylate cyclase
MAMPELPTTLFALLLSVVAALAFTDDRAARLAQPDSRTAPWRMLGVAVGLGGAQWGVHWLLMDATHGPQNSHVPPLVAAASWVLAVAASAVVAWLCRTGSGWMGLVVPGGLLTALAVVLPWGHATVISPTATLVPGWWLASAVAGLAGWVFAMQRTRTAPVSTGAQALATAALGVGWLCAHWAGVQGAGWPQASGSVTGAEGVAVPTLAMLGLVGHLVLLVMLMSMSALEQRLQRSLKQAEQALFRQASTDGLTGLLNRQEFETQMALLSVQTHQNDGHLTVLFIDLDNFKSVNEEHGNETGNRVLKAVGDCLQSHIGPGMLAGRWGNDQFAVCVPHNPTREAVARLAQQLLNAIGNGLHLPTLRPLSASIGIATYPADGGMPLITANAEQACRMAKQAGGGSYSFFDPKLIQDAREQAELLRELRAAVELRQLQLYFQPKVHAPSGQITAAEALIRWNHPARGLVSPAAFIPLAEKSGLIHAIGDWVIDEACRQIRVWRDGGLRMRVAINLSVQQLRQADLCDKIDAALKRHDINPTLLTCEITESLAMEDTEGTKTFFQQLAAVGVHISIDDFGTGYSSLAYLRQLPAQELKIDRSFVIDVATNNEARLVVDAVVKLGLALNMKVVAEGVEADEQYQVLRELGCVEIQGYLFAKPMNADMLFLWAMDDKGPSAVGFRDSLFQDTQLGTISPDPPT